MVFRVFRALTAFSDLPAGQKALRVVFFPYFAVKALVDSALAPAPSGAAAARLRCCASVRRSCALRHTNAQL